MLLRSLSAVATPAIPLRVLTADAEAFVLTLAEALHAYGAAAHRLEAMLTLVARRLGLTARLYSTPTAVIVSFGPLTDARTCLVRVDPGSMDLEKLSLLYAIAVEVIHGSLGPEDGRARIASVVGAAPRHGPAATVAAFGVSSAAAAVYFGGGAREVAASFAVGLGVGMVSWASGRKERGVSIAEPAGAALAAVAAALLAARAGPISTVVVTLAGVVTLLPGLGLTTALTELATRNLASGTARFSGAVVTLLGIGFGVGLGTRAAALLPAASLPPGPTAWGLPALAAAVVASAAAFSVLLQARPRDTGWIVLVCGVAFSGARLGAHLLGPEIGAFVGALLVGLASNAFARAFDRPSAVLQVPGLLVLVPGSIGLRSVFSLLENDAVSGVNAAFKMILVATALVAGILLASLALPPKRVL
jgi:uncharacterized membrane protein YjjP (DUF1212 family)